NLRVVLDLSYRYLDSLCRLVETVAHTSRQLHRGNCHAISRRLWPIRSDHGSAPFDPTYSMISSALASNVCGILRPSAFAVLRLMTSSYLFGACTGRSAGFSPLRIRWTYSPARRYWSTKSAP